MDATLREVISEKAGETAFDGFEKSTGALGASVKEVRDVIEMSGKTVFRDGRSHYKKNRDYSGYRACHYFSDRERIGCVFLARFAY